MESLNNQDIQLLEDFENGKLTLNDQQIVQKRLSEDLNFRKLHTNLKLLIAVITNHFAAEKKGTESRVKNFLKELEASLPEVTENIPKSTKNNLMHTELPVYTFKGKMVSFFQSKYLTFAAASVALLIVIGLLIYNRIGQNASLALFQKEFAPYTNISNPQVMGSEEDKDEFNNAHETYESESYKEAIHQFEAILKKRQDSYVLLYLANAHLACHESQKAINRLNQIVTEDPGFSLNDQVHWYLALSYLLQNNKRAVKEELSLLKDKDNILKANDIIRQLR